MTDALEDDLCGRLATQMQEMKIRAFAVKRSACSSKLSSADYRIDALRDCVYNRCGMVWTPVQRDCIEVMIRTCAPLIYNKDWSKMASRVCRQNRWLVCCAIAAFLMMRRMGKTMVLSAFTASFIYTQSFIPVGVCGKDLNHTVDIMNHVRAFLMTIDGENERRVLPPMGRNSEKFIQLYFGPNDLRQAKAFAGKSEVGGPPASRASASSPGNYLNSIGLANSEVVGLIPLLPLGCFRVWFGCVG